MPIRPENRALYPRDWKEVSRRIREERAGNRCEWCGVPNYAVGIRDHLGAFIPARGNGPWDAAGEGRTWPSMQPITYAEAREFAEHATEWEDGERHIVIVLTVAHIDHDPTNNDPTNLAALCQRCHNRYDARSRRAGIAERRQADQLTLAVKP